MPNNGATRVAALAAIAVATAVLPTMTPTRAAEQGPGGTRRLLLTPISNAAGGGPANGNSYAPDLSDDGRFVLFASDATNLAAQDPGGGVFVHDRTLGTTTRLGITLGDNRSFSRARPFSISEDGQIVVFRSNASGLVSDVLPTGPDGGRYYQVYIHDRRQGVTELVSRDLEGKPGVGDSDEPQITSDGSLITFTSWADLTRDPEFFANPRVYSRERSAGPVKVESRFPNGRLVVAFSYDASRDGRYLAFAADRLYLRDRLSGVTVDVPGDDALPAFAYYVRLTHDGRFALVGRRLFLQTSDFSFYLQNLWGGETWLLGQAPRTEKSYSLALSRDGGIIVVGRAPWRTEDTDNDAWAVIYDAVHNERIDVPEVEEVSPRMAGDTLAVTMRNPETGLTGIYVATLLQFPPGARPDAPTTLTALVQGLSVTLRWVQPPAGPLPTSYRVEAGSASGGRDLFDRDLGAVTSFTTEVVPGSYYVRVKGVNAAGESPASNELLLRVTCAPPDAPRNLTALVAGGMVRLSWQPPASGGVSAYQIEAGSATGLANLATPQTSATTYQAVAPPGTYFVRVRGRNECGLSAPSNEVVVVTGI